jgi:hypothetical protein
MGMVTVNIFFNGDTLNPGISAVVPVWPGIGFTYFRRNTGPRLLSLYLRDVDNTADLVYGDGENKVTLTALMVSNPGWIGNVDRVGRAALIRDGVNDAVAVIELTVAPAVAPTPLPTMRTGESGAPSLIGPQTAIVGDAEPGTLPEDHAATPGEISEPTESAGAWTPAAETPTAGADDLEAEGAGTPTALAAGTAEASSPGYTPTPALTAPAEQSPYAARTPTAGPTQRQTTATTEATPAPAQHPKPVPTTTPARSRGRARKAQ